MLQVLAAVSIPVAVVIVGSIFTASQSRSQQQAEEQRAQAQQAIEEQRAQDEALQGYLNEMGGLLIDEDLQSSRPTDEVTILARARTVTILSRVDARRKASIFKFLNDAGLIDKKKSDTVLFGESVATDHSVVSIKNADFSGVRISSDDITDNDFKTLDLSGVNLTKADLREIHLGKDDLSNANLSGADLSEAFLNESDLRSANLSEADLSEARLVEADLSNADLSGADLSGAFLHKATIADEQLAEASSLENATMPDGSKHD